MTIYDNVGLHVIIKKEGELLKDSSIFGGCLFLVRSAEFLSERGVNNIWKLRELSIKTELPVVCLVNDVGACRGIYGGISSSEIALMSV